MGVRDLPQFPWDALAPYAERAQQHPGGAIDLSVGSPVDETPAVVRAALAAATDAHGYPFTVGTPALREAVVAWFARRRGVPGLGPAAVIPTVGSKELVGLLPLLLGIGAGDAVVFPRIAYPTYEVGARLVGAQPVAADDPASWPANAKLVWVNSPGNPDGRVRGIAELRAAVTRARELGAVIAGDECYAELGWEAPWDCEPTPSLLDPRVTGGDPAGVLVAYSLSKQSNLAGYRAAFLSGDEAIVAAVGEARKHLGLIVPAPVQAAMTAALGDDAHVAAQRELYGQRRELLLPAVRAAGLRVEGSEAGLYLWATEDRPAARTVARLAELGILAAPGDIYGVAGAQHVRLALTASTDQVAEAARRLVGR